MKKVFSFLVLIAIFLSACGTAATPTGQPIPPTDVPQPTATTAPQPSTLTVFAAASLTSVFTEIGKTFEATHAGVTIKFNFAGSQTLRTQLEQGAVADVFASANHTEMDAAVKSGLIEQNSPQDFLTNKLIVVLPAKNPANIQSLQDLTKSGIKLVLAADTVPAGKYARQILDNISKDAAFGSDFKAKVLANVVSNENDIKQVVAKVQLGEADAGIVYISDSIAAPNLKTIEIPASFNVTAKYPIATLMKSSNKNLAEEFISYVLSTDGQNILKKWGFTPIK